MIRSALLLLLALAVPAGAAAGPIVQTVDGLVEGVAAGGVESFLGLPYAAPPVGERRWRGPQPPEPWDDVRPAAAYGPDCMQQPDPSDVAPPGVAPSEDCLYLNLWRPEGARGLPVLVWIHGGAYVNGGASPGLYDGTALAREGLVVVSFNYRLGRFGFFAHPALLAEGETGNFAYQDMVAALRWVRDNAAAFGGDPESVTLMGQSAGGDAVMHLITSPRAEGLFDRAIVMSGDGRDHVLGGLPLEAPEGEDSAIAKGLAFARAVGVAGDGPAALAALRRLPPEKVVGGLSMTALATRPDLAATHAMGAIVDGLHVLGSPGERLLSGEVAPVPLLIGSTTGDLPADPPRTPDPLAVFGEARPEAERLYGSEAGADLVRSIGTDRGMHEPARFAARTMHALGGPAWLYRWGYVPEALRDEWTAAPHASDLPFLFGTLETRFPGLVTETDRAMGQVMRGFWANFARTGDPNGEGLPLWRPAEETGDEIMFFAPDGYVGMVPDPLAPRLDLVEGSLGP
ncbi:carboxylesterase/lipase family protein [Rubellimicrobium sp. CFH 75288]|uniref:carboxylesterase/lipase family protein n=1 Tax=Rubellimicrobium sp. CFH 75288 TaxID=2697034 RepID=UPI0014122D11|nr:carboxylesterase family protein [Rubellimicrobium sp. CFH 75288]NAZ37954.1 carboxylesterase family protein [Rubellimicrobium sp. CFH 75288]